ncbi:MAG: DUF1893 domain-containing protein [Clostridia bacterium]|nr:DUF1893 domain-containing protein [Clostridia bacterium]
MMNENLIKAKEIIELSDAVFAYVCGNERIVSSAKGIGFVASLCNDKKDLSQGAAADKIVGKAAAMLFVLLGLKNVYAEIISEGAIEVFERYGVEYSFGTKTEAIINRKGDGLCPMEMAAKDAQTPEETLVAVNKKLEELRKKAASRS